MTQEYRELLGNALILIGCLGLIVTIWRCARPVWTVRYHGRADSVNFYAYTQLGLRLQARAFQRRHQLGSFKTKRGY